VVDCVLEDAWTRTIVFGRNEQQAPGGRDISFQSFDFGRLVVIIILIVERQIDNLRVFERKPSRRKRRDRPCKFRIEESRRRLPTITATLVWLMSLPLDGSDGC
jgi:hypothetical protein